MYCVSYLTYLGCGSVPTYLSTAYLGVLPLPQRLSTFDLPIF